MTSVKNKYTDDEIKETYYNDYIDKHLSIRSLEKIYNYNFRDDFKRLGLPIRNDQEKNRKYSCNEEYFKEINTEEKAYWLGFIMADGYISKNKNSSVKKFGISIKESDAEHLEKLRNAIDADAPVLHYTVTQGYKVGIGYCRITISNNTFAQYLIEHGCVEHKSNILKPPIGVPEELIHHFIRGFMDGNGSITQNNTKYGYSFSIKWVSTDEILNWIMDYLINQGILTHKYPLNKRKKEQIVSNFEFGGNYLVKKFLDFIYKDATVWLERKHDRYITLTNIINTREEIVINKKYKCDLCGNENSSNYIQWKGGEYDGYTLCYKHYQQMKKNGYIIPDKKDHCEICGDMNGSLIQVGKKYLEYRGMTLCKKHYNQLYIHGRIKDNIKGEHKNVG